MRVSFEDYFEREAASEAKHEWCAGVVYAISRGTPEHARLSASMARVLGNVLAKPCVVYGSEAMIYVERAELSTYADATVVCGELETRVVHKNGRSLGEAVVNPTIVVEVLSESTERYDRDGKFRAYQCLASMEEYVLVSQDERRIAVYRRQVDGTFSCEQGGVGEAVHVHGARIPVDDVYG